MRVRQVAGVLIAVAGCAALSLASPGRAMADPGAEDSGAYVALGDSYTSGPLIPLQVGLPPGCLRSDHNYPSLVRATLRSSSFRDVSCSGATTADMTRAQAVTGGSNPPQLDALGGGTKLVTLGIGGNDIGFTDIIKTCATISPTQPAGAACRDRYRSGGRDQVSDRIDATADKVAAVLEEIDRRAPDATVLVVGYPTVLPATGPGCFPVVPFSPGDVAYLRDTEQHLNVMLAEQAQDAGAEFVDTYASSVGHDVCRLPGTKWVEGLVPTAPAAPVHPNALGMENSARDVLKALHVHVLAGA